MQTYGRTYARLGDAIAALEQSLAQYAGQPPIASRASIARLEALRSLRNQAADELSRWAVYADQEISQAASREVVAGLNDSRGMVQSYFANPRTQAAIGARFDMLPAEQVETMLGFLDQSSPLHANFTNQFADAVVRRLEETLIDGIALGYNPRKVAGLIRRELGVGLQWAMTTARTAQLNAYREATRANYVANRDIVDGWIWYAEVGSPRTCMSCIAKHGSRHPVDEVLNDHHNGRCTAIPIVPLAERLGIRMPQVESGETYFRGLPEAQQRARMGVGMYEALRNGAFEFPRLSVEYEDPVYGTMNREATLTELAGGEEAARNWTRRAQEARRG